jgi:protein TonB
MVAVVDSPKPLRERRLPTDDPTMTTLTRTLFRAGRLGAFAFSAAALLAAAPARAQMPNRVAAGSARVWESAEVGQPPMLINERHVARLVSRAYPRQLLDFGVHGRALLLVTIDPSGRVEDAVQVGATHAPFAAAALGFAREMRFAPATVDGVPVRCRALVPVDFAIVDG